VSAGTIAADAARRVLEVAADGLTPVQRAQRRVARRPGVPARQRGRTGNAGAAEDFNRKHSRGGGGKFRKESESEHEAEQLQKQLKAAGVYMGPIDGQAGPVTLAALKAFQQANGLPPSGKLDERTRLALENPAPRSRADVKREERKLLDDKTKAKGSKGSKGSRSGSRSGSSSGGVDASDPASVRKFQEAHGLKADGVVGPQTQAAMRAQKPSRPSARSSRSRSGSGTELPGGVLRQGVGMDRKRGNGDVKAIQNALQELGYDLGDAGVDGKFGPKTAEAVRKFQQEHGLAADGVFGRHTRRLLDRSNAKSHTRRGKDDAPLSADEEPLSGNRRRAAATSVAEAALLLLEAPDAQAPTGEERKALWQRFPFVAPRDGSSGGAVALKRDKDGLFVHTHRARSKSFKSVAAIPERVVRYIESTG
jgi:peptidoglycan hydrolase-like protein with peptidoglycan-binding domain